MSDPIDTSAEAVERLATKLTGHHIYGGSPLIADAAATLRALLAERGAERRLSAQLKREVDANIARAAKAEAERDAARLKLAEMEQYADQLRAERDAALTERTRYLGPCLPPSEVAALVAEAHAKALEKAAAEVDCGCAARQDVLARFAAEGHKRASYLCPHGDACCALAAVAIRALKEAPHE